MTKVFISYSHQDEPYRQDLEKHLTVLRRNGYIDTWTDRKVTAGEEWNNRIGNELLSAKIILLLVSADFLASDYCYDIEMKTAVQLHNAKKAIVIPIILRFCDWSDTPFSKLQGLPVDGKPVKDWADTDKAFLNVVEGIKIAINNSNQEPSEDSLKFGASSSDQLSALRKRVLIAKDASDFRRLLFDLDEFKKSHPPSFELNEIEMSVGRALRYEGGETMAPRMKRSPYKSRKFAFLIVIVIILAVTIYLILHLT